MISGANEVPNEIDKLILKCIIKNSHIGIQIKKTGLMLNNLRSSQNVHNLKGLT